MQKVMIIISALFSSVAMAQSQRPFAYIQRISQNSEIDLFTYRENQSDLTRIYNLLVALKNKKMTLEEVRLKLPRGVDLRVDDKKVLILSKLTSDENHIVDYEIEPSTIDGHLVLIIKNDFILNEIIEALINNHTIYDFLSANDLFRLVLQTERGQGRDHLILAQATSKTSPQPIEKEGLLRLLDTDHMAFYGRGDLLISEFIPQNDSVSIFREIWADFWYGLYRSYNQPNSQIFLSLNQSVFRFLGFQNIDQMIPAQLINTGGMTYYTAMLAAMGYRFNPVAHNTGFYSLIESSEERKQYRSFVFKNFIDESHPYTDALDRQIVEFYERAAAAFKIIEDDPDPVPLRYKRSDIFKAFGPHTNQIYESPSFGFPFKRLLFVIDVIQKAEKRDPDKLAEMIQEGRQKKWNFMPKDECYLKLNASSR